MTKPDLEDLILRLVARVEQLERALAQASAELAQAKLAQRDLAHDVDVLHSRVRVLTAR